MLFACFQFFTTMREHGSNSFSCIADNFSEINYEVELLSWVLGSVLGFFQDLSNQITVISTMECTHPATLFLLLSLKKKKNA
jgi:hypothetical protein